nr:MAG TPA: Blasticidin M [Caudoviricetes sp.]
MEEIKRSPLPKLECGMAYLAHPYAPIVENLKVFTGEIKESNVEETGDIAYKIMSKYPNLTVLSPLHAYSFLEGKDMEETEILRYDFRLLNNCTLLILSGYWRHSRGCMAEYGYAKARGIRIYEYVDGTLYPLE